MTSRQQVLLVAAGLGATSALTVLIANVAAFAAPSPIVRQANFGTWGYSAWRADDGSLNARVHYVRGNAAELRSYATATHGLVSTAARSGAPIEGEVTFAAPVTPGSFQTLARTYGLTVRAADLRTVDAKGQRSTLNVFPPLSDPLPLEVIDQQLKQAGTVAGPLRIAGVVSARVMVPTTEAAKLAADPRVFLLDPTVSIVRHDLAANGVADAAAADVVVEPAYWTLESFGLTSSVAQ